MVWGDESLDVWILPVIPLQRYNSKSSVLNYSLPSPEYISWLPIVDELLYVLIAKIEEFVEEYVKLAEDPICVLFEDSLSEVKKR